MGHYRDDLSERQIRYDLLNGMSLRAAAIKYKCSYNLIRSIRDNKRAPKARTAAPPDELCQCCHLRPKGKGMRFLCGTCFKRMDEHTDTPLEYGAPHGTPTAGWDLDDL